MTGTDPRSFPALGGPAPRIAPARRGSETVFRKSPLVPRAVLDKVWQGDPVPPSEFRSGVKRGFARALAAVFCRGGPGGTVPGADIAERIAVFFDVDRRTARNMLSGEHMARGDSVALFALSFPGAFSTHCGGDHD